MATTNVHGAREERVLVRHTTTGIMTLILNYYGETGACYWCFSHLSKCLHTPLAPKLGRTPPNQTAVVLVLTEGPLKHTI